MDLSFFFGASQFLKVERSRITKKKGGDESNEISFRCVKFLICFRVCFALQSQTGDCFSQLISCRKGVKDMTPCPHNLPNATDHRELRSTVISLLERVQNFCCKTINHGPGVLWTKRVSFLRDFSRNASGMSRFLLPRNDRTVNTTELCRSCVFFCSFSSGRQACLVHLSWETWRLWGGFCSGIMST